MNYLIPCPRCRAIRAIHLPSGVSGRNAICKVCGLSFGFSLGVYQPDTISGPPVSEYLYELAHWKERALRAETELRHYTRFGQGFGQHSYLSRRVTSGAGGGEGGNR
jgi:hypothetical protein